MIFRSKICILQKLLYRWMQFYLFQKNTNFKSKTWNFIEWRIVICFIRVLQNANDLILTTDSGISISRIIDIFWKAPCSIFTIDFDKKTEIITLNGYFILCFANKLTVSGGYTKWIKLFSNLTRTSMNTFMLLLFNNLSAFLNLILTLFHI